ncbi:PREDICTED: probable serine/threonine-protein kinase nek3 isoform X1 [Drosophila arizonae]|uniref:Probable serine/threonine-protein kinase nek3 isoform X1 n=1 Tax=Drosophila arizonae TaxID=7263 RepID=A0ABM1PSG1_DROAR|nr:PREDICTED: probable serine/threonine-protein kinase nek3 isoform X1 [Drosophila arizonae]
MLANVPSTSSAVSASAAASAAATAAVTADSCDERTRLLGSASTPTPPPLSLSPSPPKTLTLPLVHAATHPSRSSSSNSNNNNHSGSNSNNNDNDLEASNNNYNNNDNNRSDVDDLSEETATTAGAADSSDQSDKFNRPPTHNQKKPKLSKLGTKSVGLKRVSFGSSKGFFFETLVFETPTPLSEHVEPSFGFDAADAAAAAAAGAAAGQPLLAATATAATHLPLIGSNYATYGDYAKLNMDDSGIEVQEESERSIVRVSIYQSSQPQQICPPAEYTLTSFSDNLDNTFSSYNCNIDFTQIAAATMQPTVGLGPAYDRQQSTDSGWDNPFRPGGDLSREADEIVSMIRGGKPITPTEDRTIGNGNAQHGDDNCNGATATGETVTKTNLSQNQATAQNGTNSHGGKVVGSTGVGGAGGNGVASGAVAGKGDSNNGVTSLAQVSKQVVPGPTSASHVVIDEKKNKKKGCCVVQ